MDDAFNTIFIITWSAFFISPIIGFIIFLKNREKRIAESRTCIIIFSVPIIIQILFWSLGITFSNILHSAILFNITYLSFCILYFILIRTKKKIIRYTIIPAGILIIALGYFTITLGFLGLGFIITDEIPLQKVQLNEQYNAKIYNHGWAFTSYGGRIVEINKHPLSLNIIEQTILSKTFDFSEYKKLDSLNINLTKNDYSQYVFNFTTPDSLIYTFTNK